MTTTNHGANLARLPEELILQIIESFDQGKLASMSLTCKRLACVVQKSLYSSVTQTSWTALPFLMRTLIDSPELATFVTQLNVMEMTRLKKRIRAFNYVGYINADTSRVEWRNATVKNSPLGPRNDEFMAAFNAWRRDPLVAFILMICQRSLRSLNLESPSPTENSWYWVHELMRDSFKYGKNDKIRQLYLHNLTSLELAGVFLGDITAFLGIPSIKDVKIHRVHSRSWCNFGSGCHHRPTWEGTRPYRITSLTLVDSQLRARILKIFLLRCSALREFHYQASTDARNLSPCEIRNELRDGLLASRDTLEKLSYHSSESYLPDSYFLEGLPLLKCCRPIES